MVPRSAGSEQDGGVARGADPSQNGSDSSRNDSDQRERVLEAREDLLEAREDAHTDRVHEVQSVLDAAAERDHHADARDSVADERDKAANLKAFVEGEDAAAFDARRLAAMNRSHSRTDRTSSEVDRLMLSEDEDPQLESTTGESGS